MRHVVEQLERRQLLAVITNDGAPGTIDYLSVDIGPGGSIAPGNTFYNNYLGSVLYAYNAMLDVATPDPLVANTFVHTMYDLGTSAGTEIKVNDNTVQSAGRITVDAVTGSYIDFVATTTLLPGTYDIDTKYRFTATKYDLTQATLFQVTHADGTVIGDEVLVVQGSVAGGDLTLSAVEPATYIWWRQQDGSGNLGAQLSGFAADRFGSLQATIAAGGYIAPATGDVNTTNLPINYVPFIGAANGPADVNTATQYVFSNRAAATVSTRLNLFAAQDVPLMRVYGYDTGTAQINLINDGSATRSAAIGTDFGSGRLASSHVFTIRNQGGAQMVLSSRPAITISGPNASAFRVVRAPSTYVGAGSSSSFIIQYTPTQGGQQNATVTISSNDATTAPYTFRVFGGSGANVGPDVYENDGPNTNDAARDWTTQFRTVKATARSISTQGVGQTHSIHAQTDVDWVRFDLSAPSNVVIETYAPVGDTRLYLYNSSGQRLAMDNDSGPGLSARISMSSLPAGAYYVRVDESGNNAMIPVYSLFARAGAATAAAPVSVDANRKLQILGTAQDDAISVDVFGTSLRVVRNSSTWYFPLAEVGAVEINGDSGSDTIRVAAGVVPTTVQGGDGDDVITYDSSTDAVIFGGAGNDFIRTGAGNDSVNGEDGNDTLTGGAGDDQLAGNANDDVINGGLGNDVLMGNTGDDVIHGDAGDDNLTGDEGNDTLYGDAGNDTIDAGVGRDSVESGAGADQVTTWGDGEVDAVLANKAQDILYVDDGSSSVLDVVTSSLL